MNKQLIKDLYNSQGDCGITFSYNLVQMCCVIESDYSDFGFTFTVPREWAESFFDLYGEAFDDFMGNKYTSDDSQEAFEQGCLQGVVEFLKFN